MDLLIVDSDVGARNVYAGILSSIFSGLKIRYAENAESARSLIAKEPPDLIILDFFSADQPFQFMQELTAQVRPFIVIARSDEERVIVESLKNGALDFVAKKNIKLGYLKQVLARALLEVPRWQHMQRALNEGPKYAEYEKFNGELQRYVLEMETLRQGERAGLELIPGRSYRLIFQFCTIRSPSSIMDEMSQNQMNLMLDRLGAIVMAHGGLVWTRKANASICIFAEEDIQNALIAAIEGQAALMDLSCRMYMERPIALFAMDSGQVVYTKEHGELISEALNLTAHMAEKSGFEKGILLTDALFQKLSKRAQKYFFRVEKPFEGHWIHSFEYTA
jgi:CheY-like chemotaxis protein